MATVTLTIDEQSVEVSSKTLHQLAEQGILYDYVDHDVSTQHWYGPAHTRSGYHDNAIAKVWLDGDGAIKLTWAYPPRQAAEMLERLVRDYNRANQIVANLA